MQRSKNAVRTFKRPNRIFNNKNSALQNSISAKDYANISSLTILTCKLMLHKIEESSNFT